MSITRIPHCFKDFEANCFSLHFDGKGCFVDVNLGSCRRHKWMATYEAKM